MTAAIQVGVFHAPHDKIICRKVISDEEVQPEV